LVIKKKSELLLVAMQCDNCS